MRSCAPRRRRTGWSPGPRPRSRDLDRLSPTVLEMPFDLLRHDMLMTLKRVPDERITAIVDDLFLPLVTRTSRR